MHEFIGFQPDLSISQLSPKKRSDPLLDATFSEKL